MNKMRQFAVISAMCAGLAPAGANAQSIDVMGTRAAGMGGAFVGIADDATAVYWNPAGLAVGSYFSLALDGGVRRAVPDDGPRGDKQSSFLLAATMPALGLSYYRVRNSVSAPDPLLVPINGVDPSQTVSGASQIRVDTLLTHHAGITLVQSIVPSVAVGSTLKLVRGVASSQIGGVASAEDALDAPDGEGRGTTRFDLDLGVMATSGRVKAGLTVRNVREPEFPSPDGRILKLERQARAGVSYALFSGITVAGDLDLLEREDGFGERRDAAVGVEGRLARRAWVRSGLRVNTADSEGEGASRRALTFGGTYAVTAAVLIDGVVISGGEQSGRGWGVSARFVY